MFWVSDLQAIWAGCQSTQQKHEPKTQFLEFLEVGKILMFWKHNDN